MKSDSAACGRPRGGTANPLTRLRDEALRGRALPLRLWLAAWGLLALMAPAQADIIDRVVAVVGQQAITASEVELQLRLEAMFNREPLEITDEKRRLALQRLIAVRVIQSEAIMAGFLRTTEAEVQRRLEQSKQEQFLDRLGFEQALKSYDLREQDVMDFWRQVIGYERFKDFRFKTGLEVSPAEASAFYERQIVPELRAAGNTSPPPLEEIYDRVEQAAIEERANALLEEWLKETRPQTRIVILEESPQGTQQEPSEPTAPDRSPTQSGAAPR